jgi:cytochrome c peroxidase
MRLQAGLTILLPCAVFCLVIAGGVPTSEPEGDKTYEWNLPKGFPEPLVPPDNPMTAPKVELGRHLFYDKRMSFNGKSSCATCHRQELAFTDGRAVSVGTTGELHPRNAMSLVNVAYAGALTWGSPDKTKLEDQALVPMFGTHPVELGLKEGDGFLPSIRADRTYKALFAEGFPGQTEPFTIPNVVKAIACFERSIISARSPYDRYHYDRDDNAVSASAKNGEVLFFSERGACFHCHGGFDFTDSTVSKRSGPRSIEFHNNGLYNTAGPLSYPLPNVGIYEFTKRQGDVGKFKAPTLRNISVTGPYMHDGSIATLGEVVDHYAAGGRTIASGPNAGVGRKNPNKDGRIGGFPCSPQDRADLVAFLTSLTDPEVLKDPRFGNPWPSNSK